jgi:hypothetical protein
MPIYNFKLRDGSGILEDENGVELPDDKSATQYAHDVAHELMKSRELETRSWCLDVYAEGGGRIGEIPFARVDPTLDHLTPKWRTAVEGIAECERLLGDVINAVSATVQESRALVARARGKPYLASRFGKWIIRDF